MVRSSAMIVGMGFYSDFRWARRMLPPNRCCVADVAEVTGLSVQSVRRKLALGHYKAKRAEYVWKFGGKSFLRRLWIIPVPVARQMVKDHFLRGMPPKVLALMKSCEDGRPGG